MQTEHFGLAVQIWSAMLSELVERSQLFQVLDVLELRQMVFCLLLLGASTARLFWFW